MNFRQFFGEFHWWGKLLGGFFGYLIGGPAGALFGILIGNFFDLGITRHLNQPLWHYHTERSASVQAIFFEAIFAIMGHIAKADGIITQHEIEIATQLMDEMALNKKQRTLAIQYFTAGKDYKYNTEHILSILKESCRRNPELLKLFMEIQYKTAQASGLSKEKIIVIDRIFRQLGFAPLRDQPRFYQENNFNWSQNAGQKRQQSHREEAYSPYQHHQSTSALTQAYAVLEVTPTASKQEIKRAYRRMMSKNHPDKLIAQGLPESMIKLANDKTQKITKAYEQICTSKGW